MAFEAAGIKFTAGGGVLGESGLTYAHCIEARRLLGMKQSDLAKATGLSQTLISGFESSGQMPKAKSGIQDRVAHLRKFFEGAGVEFTSDAPAGVRLRKPEP